MRTPQQLLHSRTRVRQRYALMPLEGFPPSRLPEWPGCEARILAAPALGANFVQYFLHVPTGSGARHDADQEVETFFYLLKGSARLLVETMKPALLKEGSYALVPSTLDYQIEAKSNCELLMLKKFYEAIEAEGELEFPPPVIGNQAEIPAEPYLGNEATRLQTLLPDDMAFDIAMNIFTFEPGQSLPVVETHVMEHGLYFLEGKGVYYLDNEWMEVEAGDFIWMGPFVPQSFYATGPVPSKYIYYKNVNRDVTL